MKSVTFKRVVLVVSIVLIATFLLSACNVHEPRIQESFYFNPGGPFSTNVNDEDPRRQIRCSIIFEVVDEAAIAELEEVSFIVRSSVLSVLGEITIAETTTQRDLDDIAQRIVERVNADLDADYDLILQAFFTDFALV